jgi:predicted TPR repeat methyltransferase
VASPQAERLFAEGVALHKRGLVAEAAASYANACAADPSHVAARFNLAVALHAGGRHREAESAYRQALALKPDLVQALNNLANLCLEHGRVAEALEALMRATKAAPAFAPPWNNLGNALLTMGRTAEAATHFAKALEIDPSFVEARMNLGRTLQTLGRPAEALPHLDAALAARPGDDSLRFLRDAAAGARPARPPDAFVSHLFDDMAARFDEHLVGTLGYRIPDRLAAVLGDWLDARARPRRALDLGCGTGLVGDALRGRHEEMHGVDLSPKMVEKARARRLYASVETGVLAGFLGARAPASADLLVAADVFVYVGELAGVFAQAARVLAPGGRFAFSVEGGGAGEGFALLPDGRYAHADGYVRTLAAASGLQVVHASPETIRAERGRPVAGRLYVLEAGAPRVATPVSGRDSA